MRAVSRSLSFFKMGKSREGCERLNSLNSHARKTRRKETLQGGGGEDGMNGEGIQRSLLESINTVRGDKTKVLGKESAACARSRKKETARKIRWAGATERGGTQKATTWEDRTSSATAKQEGRGGAPAIIR